MATFTSSTLTSFAGGLSRTDRFRAVDRLQYPTEVRQALGGLDRPFVAAPTVPIEGAKLSPADAFVLSRLDAPMTARQILQITPLPAEAVERSLLRLATAGAIQSPASARGPEWFDQRRAEATAVLAAASPAEVLGVPVGASRHQVKKAYLTLVRRFHPDTLVGAPAEVKSATDAAFLRVGAAYESMLSAAEREGPVAAHASRADAAPAKATVVPTEAPVAPPSEESLDDLLREGEQKLVERPWEALAIAVRVAGLGQGALHRRARLLHARAQLRNPSTVRAGELELRSILQADPTCLDAILLLAGLYKDLGLAARSASLLRRVLEIDPRNRAASAALRDLNLEGRAAP
jgi:hypothetical protein